jgi:Tetracyclin repressor-like, C-terminal domain
VVRKQVWPLFPNRAMLEWAIERGEVAPDVDVQVALHLIAEPLYLRAVFPGEQLDATYPERLADAFLRAVGARESD